MTDLYSIQDVARIFDIPHSRLRYWAQTGFINPSERRRGRMFYTFADLIHVRAARDLLSAGLSVQKVRRNLTALRGLLPDLAQPACALRLLSDGETVVARADDVTFEPLSGQILLDFSVAELSTEVAALMALPTTEAATEIPVIESQECTSNLESAAARAESIARLDEPVAIPAEVADQPTQQHGPPGAYDYFVTGCQAEDRGAWQAAESAYRSALAIQPTLAPAYTNLGNLIYRQGDALGARVAYERALELEPNQPEARFNLGNVLEDLGETELAIAELRRVCWAHPDFADAHYNLGLLLARIGGARQARKHLERYVQLDPRSTWSERAQHYLGTLA